MSGPPPVPRSHAGAAGGRLDRRGQPDPRRRVARDLRELEGGREWVEVEVAREAGERLRLESAGAPVRCRSGSGGLQHGLRHDRAEPDRHPRDADQRGGRWAGELRRLVHDQVGLPVADDRVEVGQARRQLDAGEQLGEERRAARFRRRGRELGDPAGEIVAGLGAATDREAGVAALAQPRRGGLAGGERDLVAADGGGHGKRHQRLDVPGQRPGGAEDPHPRRTTAAPSASSCSTRSRPTCTNARPGATNPLPPGPCTWTPEITATSVSAPCSSCETSWTRSS